MTTIDNATGSSLADRIQACVDEDKIQPPPLPKLTLQLRELLSDEEEADARKAAELISCEPVITAMLLRLTNSAAFGGLRQITDLNQAIARIGLKRVGAIVTAAQLKGEFKSDSKLKQRLLQIMWNHAIAVAIAARSLSERGGLDRDEGFLAGLLHDAGSLLVLRGVDYLEHEANDGHEITEPVLFDLIDAMNAPLGHHMLTQWNLPERICEVTLHLNQPPLSDGNGFVAIVSAANAIARKMGFDLRPDTEMDLLEEPSVEVLGIRDIELATLVVDLEDEIQEVQQLI